MMKQAQNNPEDRIEVNITYKLYPCDIEFLKVWAKAYRHSDWESVLSDHGYNFFDHLQVREEDPEEVQRAHTKWEIARYGSSKYQIALRTPTRSETDKISPTQLVRDTVVTTPETERVEVPIALTLLHPYDIEFLKAWAEAFGFPSWEDVFADYGYMFFAYVKTCKNDPEWLKEAYETWKICRRY